jgi:hypothetical protein
MHRARSELSGRSPLAQTWLERALLRAMDTSIVEKHDHIPVSSRQGRPPLSLPRGIPRRGFHLTAEIPQGVPLAGATACASSVEKKTSISLGSNSFGVKDIITYPFIEYVGLVER